MSKAVWFVGAVFDILIIMGSNHMDLSTNKDAALNAEKNKGFSRGR